MSTQGKFAPITNPNMDPPKISHTQDLDEIKDKIISLQNDVEKSYLEIGRLLLKAKEINGKHGEWLGWVQKRIWRKEHVISSGCWEYKHYIWDI